MTRVRIKHQDWITHVSLSRPDKKNAMDDEMIDALIAAAEQIDIARTRVVILSGEGSCFCSGIDLSGLTQMLGADMTELLVPRTHGQGTTNRWQEVAMIWRRLEIPVIAALHGEVFGAGLQLALGADIRIACPKAQLAVMEMKWGIIPDMGAMVLLPHLVRDDVMRRLVYTAQPVSGVQAEKWGLVSEIDNDPLEAAIALAEQLSRQGPNAMQAAKKLCTLARTSTENEILLAESELQATLIGQHEQMEVVTARMQQRTPGFSL